jgi:hypothetical protein
MKSFLQSRLGSETIRQFLVAAATSIALSSSASGDVPVPVPGLETTSYWPLDNNAADIVGGRNGSLLGNATFSTDVPVKLNGFSTHSLALDGTFDKLFYDVQAGDSENNEFTVAMWLKNTKPDNYSAFFGTRSPMEGGFDAKFDRDRQRVYTDIGDGMSLRSIYSTPHSVPLNEWHHVAIAVKPGLQTVYVDGSLVDTHEFSSDFTPVLFDANHDIAIGAIRGTSNDEDFRGLIDDVRIFGRALTAAEVLSVYSVPEPHSVILTLIASVVLITEGIGTKRKRKR